MSKTVLSVDLKIFENVLSKCRGLLYCGKCLDQEIDFTDPVERDKRNWLKGACFVIGIVLSNYKKNLKFLNLYVAIGRS